MHLIKKIKAAHQELALLLVLFALAVGINTFSSLPGSLIVMALFFVLLKMDVLKADSLSTITPFLLVNISFFFIPPAVRVVDEAAALDGVVFKLLVILVLSNMLVMGVTGYVVQAVIKKGGDHE